MTVDAAEKSQQCYKYFLQYSTFTSERPQVRTWGNKIASCPGRHLTSARSCDICSFRPIPLISCCRNSAYVGACFWRHVWIGTMQSHGFCNSKIKESAYNWAMTYQTVHYGCNRREQKKKLKKIYLSNHTVRCLWKVCLVIF